MSVIQFKVEQRKFAWSLIWTCDFQIKMPALYQLSYLALILAVSLCCQYICLGVSVWTNSTCSCDTMTQLGKQQERYHFIRSCQKQQVQSLLVLWKNPQANHSGGIWIHDLCIARGDVLPLDHRSSPGKYWVCTVLNTHQVKNKFYSIISMQITIY